MTRTDSRPRLNTSASCFLSPALSFTFRSSGLPTFRPHGRTNAERDDGFCFRIPFQILERPSSELSEAVREMSARISGVARIALCLLGGDPYEAWNANRTLMVRRLREKGEDEFADALTAVCLQAWEYSLTKDVEAARRAVKEGIPGYRRAVDIGRRFRGKRTWKDRIARLWR